MGKMKIAVASDDGQTISAHFGRTRGFLIYEIDGQEITNRIFRENDFTGHARGLSGVSHHVDRHGPILEALGDCAVVISHGMGRRIYDDLSTAGIETFIVNETDADEAVKLYLSHSLTDNPDQSCEHE